MSIAFTTMGCDGGLSGIGRYVAALLEHWSHCPMDIEIYGHESERTALVPDSLAPHWRPVPERFKSPLASVAWHQTLLPFQIRKQDVLFLPAGNRRLPVYHTIPAVGTVHDCSSLHIHGKYDRARDFYIKQILPRLMRQLDHVLTVSESTRCDLIERCGVEPGRITVIPLASDPTIFFPRDIQHALGQLRKRYALRDPYLLYTSRIEHPGKNHTRLIKAFELLKVRHRIPHQLVFVGPDKERAHVVHAAAASSAVSSDILFAGAVPGEDLPLFYSAADALVFPSLYEGFGLPLLEAMGCGAPVVCSDRSSLPEVAGSNAILFNPEDPDSIAAAVRQLLMESPDARGQRIAAGRERAVQYSWQRTADATLRVLQQVAGRGRAG